MEKILLVKVIDKKGNVRFVHHAKPIISDFIGGTKAYKVPESLMPRIKALTCDGNIWLGVETVEQLRCFGDNTSRYKFTPDKVYTEKNPLIFERGESDETWEIFIKAVDLYC